jgi:hypothetical protein
MRKRHARANLAKTFANRQAGKAKFSNMIYDPEAFRSTAKNFTQIESSPSTTGAFAPA